MSLIRRSIQTLLIGATLVSSAFAANTPQVNVAPKVRIAARVDKAKTVTVADSVPGKVALSKETGRLSGSTQLTGLKLVLKSTDEQESALANLLDKQQDRGTSTFHQWMTPDAFGATFGVAQADIVKVTAWLADAGLKVESVSPGGRIISFSGSASAVEAAFSTEIHTYMLNGESRFSNATPISFPEALSPVVIGVSKLNNFTLKSNAVNPHPVVKGKDGNFYPVLAGTKADPDYTSVSSGSHYIGPLDVGVIFNAAPLQAAGIDGTGQTIGVIGQSTISLSNVETFRSLFKLPVNDPVIINVGTAPLQIGDDIESDLDVEWAGALATGAKVLFGTASESLVDSGVDTSALYFVDNNNADILTLSYGGCESGNGAAGTAFWNTLWEQAAAQGQSVFVSTGDSSSTGCASSSATLATGTNGVYAVNALGSSAFNVAVGGTGFYEGPTIAFQTGPNPYWGVGGVQPYGTALSYIPEVVWSEGAFDVISQGTGVAGGGGGVSLFTGRPSWQVGVGISPTADPAGPTFTATGAIPATKLHRLVPDVAGIAAGGHDGTIFCSEGVCALNADGTVAGIGVVGGTSVATPTTAGMQALINQKNGGRQGNPNYYYYKLAAAEPSITACAATIPTGSAAATAPAATCYFHDVIAGDNYSPKTSTGKYVVATGTIQGTLGTDYIGFPATQGFDEATGLGSPNVANLANNWNTVTFNSTTTTLSLSKTTFVHGTTVTASIAVAANSSSAPVPTGDVSISAVGQTSPYDGNFFTLTAGSVSAALAQLPGGTYNVVAKYAGDSVDGASTSAPVQVTVSKEPSVMTFLPYYISAAGAVTQQTSFVYGLSTYFDTEIIGSSTTGYTSNGGIPNTGSPTGIITYTATSPGQTLPTVTSTLDVYGTTFLEIAQALTNFAIPQNYPAIIPAAYSFTASYPGDNSFGAISSTVPITIIKASPTPALTASTTSIVSGGTAEFYVTVATSGGGVAPTGSVTLSDVTSSVTLGTAPLVAGVVDFSTTAITGAPGAHSITATYAGDGNYNGATSTAKTVTIVVGVGPVLALSNASVASPLKVLNTATLVCTSSLPATATTAVAFYDAAKLLGTANILTTGTTATLNITSLIAGTHNVTCSTAGTATVPSSTSPVFALVIAPNTPTVSLTSGQAQSTSNGVSMNSVFTANPAIATYNPAPSLPISFYDGTTLLGTAPIVKTLNYGYYTAAFTTPLFTTPGTHVLTAQYPAGDPNYSPATSGTQTISIGLTTLAITAYPTAPVGQGTTQFTLSAKVTPIVANTKTITGTVTFYDGTTVIGTAAVGTGGVATTTTAVDPLGPGVRTITAVYTGDANYYTSSTTASVTITTIVPTATFSISPSTLNIVRGTAGLLTASISTTGNYVGTFTITCAGLPANTTCPSATAVFTATSATPQTAAISIVTTAPTPLGSGFLWIPAIFFAGLLLVRRKQFSTRSRQMLALAVVFCGATALTGCGKTIDHNAVQSGTPLGSATLTFTATPSATGGSSPATVLTSSVTINVVPQ